MGYTYRFLKPEHQYWDHWQERRRLYKRSWIATLAWLPVTLIAAAIFEAIFQAEWPVITVILISLPFPISYYFEFFKWPCPKCERPFWPRRERCRYCGLQKYAPCDPDDQQWEYESHLSDDS